MQIDSRVRIVDEQQFIHPPVYCLNRRFVEQSARHAALIADRHDGKAKRPCPGDRIGRAGHQHDLIGITEVAIVDDERVIPVKKYGWFGHRDRFLCDECTLEKTAV